MSKEKTLEDVIGFLMNVAEFDLEKTKRVPIPGGAMTVTSENYQFMYEVIEWTDNRLKEQKLNENQEEYLEWLKKEWSQGYKYLNQFMTITSKKSSFYVVARLNNKELSEVYTEFFGWALDQC